MSDCEDLLFALETRYKFKDLPSMDLHSLPESQSLILQLCPSALARSNSFLVNSSALMIHALNLHCKALFTPLVASTLTASLDRLVLDKRLRKFAVQMTLQMNGELRQLLVEFCLSKTDQASRISLLWLLRDSLSEERLAVLFHSLLAAKVSITQASYVDLLRDLFVGFPFVQHFDGEAFTRANLRTPEVLFANLACLPVAAGAFDGLSILDVVVPALFSALKSAKVEVVASAEALLLAVAGSEVWQQRLLPLLLEKSVSVQGKIHLVNAVCCSAQVLSFGFDTLLKAFQREISDVLRGKLLICLGKVVERREEFRLLLLSLLNSAKLADKKVAVEAAYLASIQAENPSSLISALVSNAECVNEAIFALAMHSPHAQLAEQQFAFMQKIHAMGKLQLKPEVLLPFLKVFPNGEAVRMLLDFVLCSQLESEIASLVPRCFEAFNKALLFSPIASRSKLFCKNLKRLFAKILKESPAFAVENKISICKLLLSALPEEEWKFVAKFYRATSIECDSLLKQVEGIVNLERTISFLCSLRDADILRQMIQQRKEDCVFWEILFRYQPKVVVEHVNCFYRLLLQEKKYFFINSLVLAFKFSSKHQGELIRQSLFQAIWDNSLISTEWLSALEQTPLSPPLLVVLYPLIALTIKMCQVESTTCTLFQLIAKCCELNFNNFPLLSLIEKTLPVAGYRFPAILESLSQTIMGIEKSTAISIMNSHSTDIQKALAPFMFSESPFIRKFCLGVLIQHLECLTPGSIYRIWTLKYDEGFEIASLATQIASTNTSFIISEEALKEFEEAFFAFSFDLSEPTIKGFCSFSAALPNRLPSIFTRLLAQYAAHSTKGLRNVRPREESEKRAVRDVISQCFVELDSYIAPHGMLNAFVEFFFAQVIDYEAEEEETIVNIVDALTNAIASQADWQSCLALMQRIERSMPISDTKAKILALCSLVKLIPKENLLFEVNVRKCIEFASYPNENVQSIISSYLAKCWNESFLTAVKNELLPVCTSTTVLSHKRKGSALLVASFVKTLGIKSVDSLEIVAFLKMHNASRQAAAREGCIFLVQSLSLYLGRLFEPYAVHFIPFILSSFADANAELKAACNSCIATIMKSISQHALSLILPTVLGYLQETSWKMKASAALILGSMSNLAPKLLSRNLGTIISKLGELLKDPHPQVQTDGKLALDSFAEQVKTPEIRLLAPSLIATITDPNSIARCLDVILSTSFGHYLQDVDLCFLFPVLLIGFQNHRTSEVKRKSAQILGNILKLTEPDILKPYLPTLVECLMQVSVSAVAEVRSTIAKVLGLLYELFALEQNSSFDWIIPTLVQEMAAGKHGSAQTLSEILGSCQEQTFNAILPRLLQECQEKNAPELKRGAFLKLFEYFPTTLKGNCYAAQSSTVFPVLVQCLCDDSESIRDSALKSCQLILQTGANAKEFLGESITLLEESAFNWNFKVRLATIQLISSYLGTASESGQFLAIIYLSRMDSNPSVKMAAFQAWKSLVSNSARTIKEVMPNILRLSASLLSIEPQEEAAEVATKTLQELTIKLEEKVLQSALQEEVSQNCNPLGMVLLLLEICKSTSRPQIALIDAERFFEVLVPLVAVGEPFARLVNLVKPVFAKQVDEVFVPFLADQILDSSKKSSQTIGYLFGIKGFMPTLLSKILLQTELSEFSIQIVRQVIASEAMIPYASDLFKWIIGRSIAAKVPESEIIMIAQEFVSSVSSTYGLCDELGNLWCTQSVPAFAQFYLAFGASLMDFCSEAVAGEMLKHLFTFNQCLADECFVDQLMSFISAAGYCTAVCECISRQPKTIVFSQKLVDSVASFLTKQLSVGEESLPLIRSINALLAVYKLKSVISLVGLLIRMLGERLSEEFNLHALNCLLLLVQKNSTALRPFLPQLTRLCTRFLSQEGTCSSNEVLKSACCLLRAVVALLPAAKVETLMEEYAELKFESEEFKLISICILLEAALKEPIPVELAMKMHKLACETSQLQELAGCMIGLVALNLGERAEALDILHTISASESVQYAAQQILHLSCLHSVSSSCLEWSLENAGTRDASACFSYVQFLEQE